MEQGNQPSMPFIINTGGNSGGNTALKLGLVVIGLGAAYLGGKAILSAINSAKVDANSDKPEYILANQLKSLLDDSFTDEEEVYRVGAEIGKSTNLVDVSKAFLKISGKHLNDVLANKMDASEIKIFNAAIVNKYYNKNTSSNNNSKQAEINNTPEGLLKVTNDKIVWTATTNDQIVVKDATKSIKIWKNLADVGNDAKATIISPLYVDAKGVKSKAIFRIAELRTVEQKGFKFALTWRVIYNTSKTYAMLYLKSYDYKYIGYCDATDFIKFNGSNHVLKGVSGLGSVALL